MDKKSLILYALCLWACGDDTASKGIFECMNTLDPCPVGTSCSLDEQGNQSCSPNGNNHSPALDALVTDHPDTRFIGRDNSVPESNDGGVNGAVDTNSPSLPDGGNSCGNLRLLLKPNPGNVARIMLVVDRSWSMLEFEDRWTPTVAALGAVTNALNDGVQFGLVLFPNPSSRNPPVGVHSACVPGMVNVEPGQDRSADIVDWLNMGQPARNMGTPTASALQSAAEALLRNPTGNDYLLLATDGGPGCNNDLNSETCVCNTGSNCVLFEAAHNCLDDGRTADLIGNLATQGIKTMVLGITRGQNPEGNRCQQNGHCPPGGQACVNGTCRNQLNRVLDAMAVAGQTAINGHHFEVTDLGQLEDQVAAAAGSVAPCIYDLGALADEAHRLSVAIDGMPINRDPNHGNGWDVNGETIEFYGAACASLRDGRAHEIQAGCQ
jgi:hypothetical protein